MTPDLQKRYQPGGDIYAQLEGQYGRNAALLVAHAAGTGISHNVTEAIARVRNGERLDDSTASILWTQLSTDPIGAPLDAFNRAASTLAGNTALAVLRNPMVLLVLALVAAGVWINFFGLPKFLRR